jgi:hypothetical membrane protein
MPSVRHDDRMTRRLAWAGVAGVAVYVVIDVALAFLRPDYSLLHNAESDYGVGPWSWLMDVNFLLRCAATLAVVAAMARGMARPPALRAALALLMVWAVASGLLAFFPDDPAGTPATPSGRIHLLIALIAFLAVAAGTLMASIAMHDDPSWRSLSVPLMVISGLAILVLLLLGRHGFAARSDGGLLERIFLALELLWLLLVGLRLAGGPALEPAADLAG